MNKYILTENRNEETIQQGTFEAKTLKSALNIAIAMPCLNLGMPFYAFVAKKQGIAKFGNGCNRNFFIKRIK